MDDRPRPAADRPLPTAAPPRAARLATFAFFALNGFLMGMWIVHLPAVEHRTGVDHAVLGRLLLLLGAGAFAGMRLVGPLVDRFGARRTVPAGAALCATALVLPALATDGWTLGAALLVLGFGNGALDVGMNVHAVQVERAYRRPVMSAFHATFSLGGVLAALAGAPALGRGWPPAVTLAAAALLGLAVTLCAAPALLGREPKGQADGEAAGRGPAAAPAATGPGAASRRRRRTSGRVRALAGLALLLMLCEGVANDWSVLHLRDVLGAPAATAALAYGCFSTAMTVGRLLTDRVAARFGPVGVLRCGAAVAAIGLTAAALSPWTAPALTGWAVFGIGLSGCVPQLFSAAGHADRDAAGANVSRVAGLGYLGMLAGPAVIGPLTRVLPLNLTFLLPVAFCVIAVCAAGVLRPPSAAPAGEGSVPRAPARDAAH